MKAKFNRNWFQAFGQALSRAVLLCRCLWKDINLVTARFCVGWRASKRLGNSSIQREDTNDIRARLCLNKMYIQHTYNISKTYLNLSLINEAFNSLLIQERVFNFRKMFEMNWNTTGVWKLKTNSFIMVREMLPVVLKLWKSFNSFNLVSSSVFVCFS